MVAAFTVRAASWVEVGDRELRGDLEVLAAYGLITGPMSTWPLPSGFLVALRDEARLNDAPEHVRLAARRVSARLGGEGNRARLRPAAELRFSSEPDLVRDFGASARNQLDARAGVDVDGNMFSVQLRGGLQSRLDGREGKPSADGTSVNLRLGGWQAYGGWIDHWYGPGWTSSLILSNNARPFPKIGVMRDRADAFQTPWLSWLGPWQIDAFVGLLEDGDRTDRNTGLGSVRLSIVPLPGLEIAVTRITEFCGSHHRCNPLRAAFIVTNNDGNQNISNDEAAIDVEYRYDFGVLSFSPYLQLMNDDTGPFTHSYESYLGGASWAGPAGDSGAHWRLTTEYADTRATLNAFGFDRRVPGLAYNNAQYVDGMRYRGRTLGFSQDSDSTLASVALSVTDRHGIAYRLAYFNAHIDTAQLAATQAAGGYLRNAVSAQPVTVNQVSAGIALPWRDFMLDLVVRYQDRRPYPATGAQSNVEAGLRY